jgi:hypothetical protein
MTIDSDSKVSRGFDRFSFAVIEIPPELASCRVKEGKKMFLSEFRSRFRIQIGF